jgi:hypothetical protein
VRDSRAAVDEAKRLLDWAPSVDLRTGLRLTVDATPLPVSA